MATAAAIVLAGGASLRMGAPKALLDWHGTPLVRHVAATLTAVCEPVVVVGAPGTPLPVPAAVETATDAAPGRGPLAGVAAGMEALAGRGEIVFLAATDLPLLHPDFVRAVLALLAGNDAAVPVLDGRDQPLAAAYTATALAPAGRLLESGESRLSRLLEGIRVRRIDAAELPAPESLLGANTPESYRALLARG